MASSVGKTGTLKNSKHQANEIDIAIPIETIICFFEILLFPIDLQMALHL
jgi:hypothetical protein